MIKEFLEQQVFMYVMLSLCLAGIVVELALFLVCGSLVKASLHIADTKNRLFKLMRLKFEAYYKLKISVHNVEKFVDKYMINHKFCGVFLHTWKKFTSQMMFLCICLGISGAVLGMIENCDIQIILKNFGVGLLMAAFLHILDGLCAFDFKWIQIKANTVDYFDNFLRGRLENEYFHSEEMKDYQQEYFEKDSQEQIAASRESILEEPMEEQKEKSKEVRPEPVPAKRRRAPEMFVPPAQEMAAAKEGVKVMPVRKSEKDKKEQEILDHNIEEMEKEKIIEDILKEYLV